MLRLQRVTNPYQFERCHISKAYIKYGEYYYYDDEDGLIVSLEYYNRMKRQKREEDWDYTKFNNLQSAREYEDSIKEYTRQYLSDTLMDRKIDKGPYNQYGQKSKS